MSQQSNQQQPAEPLHCECCGWPVRVVGDAAEGTQHYEPISDAALKAQAASKEGAE